MASSLQGRYGATLAIALFALVPYILVASGASLYRNEVVQDIGATHGALSVIEGLSTAGYAFGALLGGDLINRFPQKRLFLACEAIFVIGWLLVAVAGDTVTFGAGRVLSGLATGLLLVIALPPVVRRFPPSRLPFTAAFINFGLFGALAVGPLLGGAIAAGHLWRALYAAFAGLGVITVISAIVVLPHADPPNPDLPVDRSGLALGLAGTVLPFWASGELSSAGFGSILVAVPLAIGLTCFVTLMLVEYHKSEPLSPVKMMWTTFPVIGTLIAMIGGGAFVTFLLLTVEFLTRVVGKSPLAAGLTFWPQVLGALVTAAILGVLFRTRFLPLLAYAGMIVLIAGGALLMVLDTNDAGAQVLAAVGLLGLGAGATVSPGLFLAGFAMPVRMLGRIFALIELVRSVADFILAPVMRKVATASSATALDAAGVHEAIWITLLITLAGFVVVIALHVLGRAGLPQPDMEAWLEHDRTAIPSPRLIEAVRPAA